MNPYTESNIKTNLVRLRRQFDLNIKGFDQAALWDLSAVLRNWADMRLEVTSFLLGKGIKPDLYGYVVPSEVKKFLNQREYLITHLPTQGVVVTPTPKPNSFTGELEFPMLEIEAVTRLQTTDPFMINLDVKKMSDITQTICVRSVAIIFNAQFPGKDALIGKFEVKKFADFGKWIDSECLRISFVNDAGNLQNFKINREVLIRRCANMLGGSHPQGYQYQYFEVDNAINKLLQIRTLSIPIIYYVLLHIAQEILKLESKI